jgi:hypothetical protein
MLRYIKAAFWARMQLPGLGPLPLNALATLGFAILGFGHPAFWLLGVGLESGYLALVATQPRFQRLVAAQERAREGSHAAVRRQELVAKLLPASRERMARLETTCTRVQEVEAEDESIVRESNRDALGRLAWIYLKLLLARDRLEAARSQASQAELESRVAALSRDLEAPGTTSELRESQQATLKLLQQRLANLARAAATVKEVDSDLARIEAQVDLALDNARLDRGDDRGDLISGDITLASHLLGGGLDFGEAEPAVAELDRVYAARRAQAAGVVREGRG